MDTTATPHVPHRLSSERGAILIQVGVAILVLSAFGMFIVDYGVMWVSRHQAQNSADAGALAGATSLALDSFTDRTDTGPAKVAARSFARANYVWGTQPDVQLASDVRFYPDAPLEFPADCAADNCVRVDVYRNQARGNALPMFFGLLVGLVNQGVRATATAQASAANASNCMKPWAIADKWEEHNPKVAPWDPTQEYDPTGATPDVYKAPSEDGKDTGTSFTVKADLGRKLLLKAGNPKDAINPGWFQALELPCASGNKGADCYRENISGCTTKVFTVDQHYDVPKENGNMVGPTKQGVDDLIALDPDAVWDADNNRVAHSCVEPPYSCKTPGLTVSPRVVPVPIFDLDAYMQTGGPGKGTVHIVNILGFFVDKMQGNDVNGYIAMKSDLLVSNGGSVSPSAAFLQAIRLVR